MPPDLADPRRPPVAGPGAPEPDPFALLGTGLRSGADTVAELAALAMTDEQTVRRALERLEDVGYLSVSDDRIAYALPAEVVADAVRHRAGDLGAEIVRQLGELAEVVGRLPALARDRDVGQAASSLLDVEVFHGPEAVVDLWHLKQAKDPSRCTDVVLPDASHLYVADPAMQRVWHEASSGEGRRARVIASIADATHPEAQRRVAEELAGGVQIRVMDEPPGWFWVTDDTTVALPLAWGERWPTSVMSVRSRAVAGMARWVFDRLWERAVPIATDAASWDPLLELMNGGATLEAASRALGISERTGRRRLSEAMDHYGVASTLALGAAWGSARRR